MRQLFRIRSAIVLLAFVVALVGCGPKVYEFTPIETGSAYDRCKQSHPAEECERRAATSATSWSSAPKAKKPVGKTDADEDAFQALDLDACRKPTRVADCELLAIFLKRWPENKHRAEVQEVIDGSADKIAKLRVAEKAKAKAAGQWTLDEEIEEGKCSEDHVETLRNVASGTTKAFPELLLTGKLFVVATDTEADLTWTALFSKTYHVIAVGFAPLSLTLSDGQGYAVKTESAYAAGVRMLLNNGNTMTGRAVAAGPSEKFKVRVQGRGCVLIMVLLEV